MVTMARHLWSSQYKKFFIHRNVSIGNSFVDNEIICQCVGFS